MKFMTINQFDPLPLANVTGVGQAGLEKRWDRVVLGSHPPMVGPGQ
jgi:hypothetical protein